MSLASASTDQSAATVAGFAGDLRRGAAAVLLRVFTSSAMAVPVLAISSLMEIKLMCVERFVTQEPSLGRRVPFISSVDTIGRHENGE